MPYNGPLACITTSGADALGNAQSGVLYMFNQLPSALMTTV
jgi:hypothetical protein